MFIPTEIMATGLKLRSLTCWAVLYLLSYTDDILAYIFHSYMLDMDANYNNRFIHSSYNYTIYMKMYDNWETTAK